MSNSRESKQNLDAELFAALGHETRCTIFEFLATHSARPTEIAKRLENVFGLWHHLNRLVAVNLVIVERLDHKHSMYSVNPLKLAQVAEQLAKLAQRADRTQKAQLAAKLAENEALAEEELIASTT